MPKKVAPPERLTLAKLSGKHNIPMQVGTWMFKKNASKQFQGAKATEVDLRGQGCIEINMIYHDHAQLYL